MMIVRGSGSPDHISIESAAVESIRFRRRFAAARHARSGGVRVSPPPGVRRGHPGGWPFLSGAQASCHSNAPLTQALAGSPPQPTTSGVVVVGEPQASNQSMPSFTRSNVS